MTNQIKLAQLQTDATTCNIEDTASAVIGAAMNTIEDIASAASDDEDIEDTASAAWLMQEEINFILSSLMDSIPKLIPPLAQIIKQYMGVNALFVGLGLYCYDIQGALCP